MADVFQINVSAQPSIRVTVAGLVGGVGGTGDILTISKFIGVTGLETSYTAGGAGSTGGSLAGKTAFIAFKGSAKMDIVTSGVVGIDEIKIVGNAISWALELNVGEEIIIIAK